jgi:hypothetical protein
MDGIGKVVAACAPVPIAGRTYLLAPLTLARIGAVEQHLLDLRRHPVDMIEPALAAAGDGVLARLLYLEAYEEIEANKLHRLIPFDDFRAWIDTADGVAMTAWLCLPGGPFPALEDAEAWVMRASRAEIKRVIRVRDLVSGFDLLSRLDWPLQPDSGGDAAGRFIPWKKLFRVLIDEHHWTPAMIGELTLYQVKLLRAREVELGGVMQMDRGEAVFLRAQRAEFMAEVRAERRQRIYAEAAHAGG